MKITVKVITSSSQQKLVQISENEYRVYIHAKPIKGEANTKIREIISDYFNVPKSKVVIVSGKTAKLKILEIKQ